MSAVNLTQVKTRIIQPMLNLLPSVWNNQAACNLLAYTFLAESGGGQFIAQIGGGPAIGPFQMETATHDDCWTNYLSFNPELARVGRLLACGGVPSAPQMAGNWSYAAFMARVRYIRSPLALPAAGDAVGIVTAWKNIYNTAGGAGVIDAAHIALAEQAIAA